LKTLLPEEIKYLLDNYEAEDSSLTITKADYSDNTPNLSLTLHQPGTAPQLWTLEVIGHRDSQLSFSNIIYDTTIMLTDDHPLLWQYADEQCELYFNGSSKDTAQIITELKQIDFDLFGTHQKSGGQLNTLLQTSNGSLGKGSKKLLTKYAVCLNKYNIQTSIIGGHTPTYSDGKNQYSGETLKLFFIRGSYIVGQDFIFNKHD
jgi:hypothetical protein